MPFHHILQECERLLSDPVPGIFAIPHKNNVRQFDVSIDGPFQSPYESLLCYLPK